jgi:septum formation protein
MLGPERPSVAADRGPTSRTAPLILASRSPQRTAILTQLGIAHTVAPADVDELSEGDPLEVALENARRKAGGRPSTLGVDTLVALDDRIYGKPRDADEARATLLALSGRTHRVVSGLVYEDDGVTVTTEVTFRSIEPLLDWYLAADEWQGRAGGYAIQGRGAAFVRGIHGDYFNVVGLPVAALLDLLGADALSA